MRLRFAALLPFILVALIPTATWGSPTAAEEVIITSHDGVKLAATLFLPASSGPRPAVIVAHGFGADRQDEAMFGQRYAGLGWVVLTYDARGFGQSEGQVSLNGPDETMDVASLVSFLASRDEVLLDAEGDPRVAMRGGSYGGAIQLLAAANDDRIDALVPLITWNDLVYSLSPNDVPKAGWINAFFLYGNAAAHGVPRGNPNPGGFDPAIVRHYANTMATGRLDDETEGYLRERSPTGVLHRVRAPVYLVQGRVDTLFTPTEAQRTYQSLQATGVAAKLLLYDGGHGHDQSLSAADFEAREQRIDSWLRLWLDGAGSAEDVFAAPIEWWDPATGAFVPEQVWPPTDAGLGILHLSASSAMEGALSPQAPTDASRLEIVALAGGSQTSMPVVSGQADVPEADAPGTSVSYLTAPMATTYRFVGGPRLQLHLAATDSEVAVFTKLALVDAQGGARVLDQQVTAFRTNATSDLSLATPRSLEVELVPMGVEVPAGNRLRFTIATSDAAYSGNRAPARVAIFHGPATPSKIEFPLLPSREGDSSSPTIGPIASEWDLATLHVEASSQDPDGVWASAYVFWNESGRARAASTLPFDGSSYRFELRPSEEASDFRLRVADAAGHVTIAPFGVEARPQPPSRGTPWSDLTLLALATVIVTLACRRR